MSVKKSLRAFLKSESGASMVEYGIALLVITAIGTGGMMAIGTTSGAQIAAACDTFTSTSC
jgi:Flp pilus assembly pilin Flp